MNKLGLAVIHIYFRFIGTYVPTAQVTSHINLLVSKKKKRQIVQGVPSDKKRPFPKEED